MTHHCDTCGKEKEVEPKHVHTTTNGFCRRTETDCVAAYLAWNRAGCPGKLTDFYKTTWQQMKKEHAA